MYSQMLDNNNLKNTRRKETHQRNIDCSTMTDPPKGFRMNGTIKSRTNINIYNYILEYTQTHAFTNISPHNPGYRKGGTLVKVFVNINTRVYNLLRNWPGTCRTFVENCMPCRTHYYHTYCVTQNVPSLTIR